MGIRNSLLLWSALMLVATSAYAASVKTIRQQIDAADLQNLELDISVAELDIEIVEGTTIELEISLRAQRRFFGLRSGSVDRVELENRRTAGKLLLGIDAKTVEQEWVLSIPRHLDLEINMGVGEVRIDKLENNLQMDLGVGSVRVGVVETAFAEIQLSASVGEAAIQGMNYSADSERGFVSADVYYQGPGAHRINIDVGVGEILVRGD